MDTTAILAELLDVLADALRTGDLGAHLDAWRNVCAGRVTPGTRAPMPATPDERAEMALRMAQSRAGVSSGDLAAVAHVTPEAARLTLVALARTGHLVAHGANKARHYTLPATKTDAV